MTSFKIGDVVECLKDCKGAFTSGKKYEVLQVNGNRIEVINDKGNPMDWVSEYFKDAQPFINLKPTLKPGVYGFLHVTQRNECVKVSVKGMTNSDQIRASINQLETIAEFWENKK